MGYTSKESQVRVDIFKASGKWYTTIEVDMNDVFEFPFIHDALKMCLEKTTWKPAVSKKDSDGWFAVCLEPYHVTPYPIVIWLRAKS